MSKYLFCVLFNIDYIINGIMTPFPGTMLDDTLIGNELSNIISGRQGSDTMTGGDSMDYFTFVVDNLDNSSDTITDYTNEDKIYLINKPPNVGQFSCQQMETTTELWFGGYVLGQIMDVMDDVTVTVSTDTGMVDTIIECDPLPIDPNATTLAPTSMPSETPSMTPTTEPTMAPTIEPTISPTLSTESPTTDSPTLGTEIPTKKPSNFPTCAPLVRTRVTFLEETLDCDAGIMLTPNPNITGCDGLLITANNLKQLICADIGGCNRTEFNVAAPDNEYVNIEFKTDSFVKGVLNAVNPDKVTCRDNACLESVISLECDASQPCLVSCDGEFGCQFSKFIIQNGGDFDCIKMNACQGFIVEFDRTDSNIAGSILNCDGNDVCKDGSIINTNGLTEITCQGPSSCENLFIEYELTPGTINIQIDCSELSSCKNVDIDLTRFPNAGAGAVNVILNITCNGVDSCYGFDVSQDSINIDATVICEFTSSCENAFIAGSPFSAFINPAYNFEPENGNPNIVGDCKNNRYTALLAIISISVGLNVILFIMLSIQVIKQKKKENDEPSAEQISAEIVNATKESPQEIA